MNEEKKSVFVTLELEPAIAEYHSVIAAQEGVSLEKRLLEIIKTHSPVGGRDMTGAEVRTYFENLRATGKFKGHIPDFEE